MTRRSMGVPRALKDWRSVLLLAAADEMLARLERELEPIGLTWQSCRILALIGRLGPVRQSAVTNRLGIDRTTMSKTIRTLSDLQFVYPQQRAFQLTAHGEQVLAHAEYAVDQAERAMFGRLGVTRARRLEQDLRSIAPRQV